MRNVLKTIGLALLIGVCSCSNKHTAVSLEKFADTANYFAEKIADFESKQDMSDIDLYMQMEDSG